MPTEDQDAAQIVGALQEAFKAEKSRTQRAQIGALLLLLIRQGELTAKLRKDHEEIMDKQAEILDAIHWRNQRTVKP